MAADRSTHVATLAWVGGIDGYLTLIDQTLLPTEVKYIECRTAQAVREAIKTLRVRGAPAIGIAAAYGVVLGLQRVVSEDEAKFITHLNLVVDELATSRPTAVNLFWALRRMQTRAEALRHKMSPREILTVLLAEARAIEEQDRQECRRIGRFGEALLSDGQGVMTHCNAGGLATAGYGTALALFFAAQDAGKHLHVYACETRPLLQGARLTAWELHERGIRVTLICDSMAAAMREGRVKSVVTGADRIAANGDTANKIGTYGLAALAAVHDIPFYVAAPTSTFDRSIATGDQIPIEQRDPREITHGFGRQTAPDGIDVYNPAFDVTPARLIKAIICERGVIEPVTTETIADVLR